MKHFLLLLRIRSLSAAVRMKIWKYYTMQPQKMQLFQKIIQNGSEFDGKKNLEALRLCALHQKNIAFQ